MTNRKDDMPELNESQKTSLLAIYRRAYEIADHIDRPDEVASLAGIHPERDNLRALGISEAIPAYGLLSHIEHLTGHVWRGVEGAADLRIDCEFLRRWVEGRL